MGRFALVALILPVLASLVGAAPLPHKGKGKAAKGAKASTAVATTAAASDVSSVVAATTAAAAAASASPAIAAASGAFKLLEYVASPLISLSCH